MRLGRASCLAFLSLFLLTIAHSRGNAQTPYLGEIRMFAGNFAPTGWALCNGDTLSISQNVALFSILGTTYGGNGVTNFRVPDLRGRVPVGMGQGTGLTARPEGETGGEETHTLSLTEMPAHTHAALVDTSVGANDRPAGGFPARNGAGIPQYGAVSSGQLSSTAIGSAGGGQPHNNMQPYLVINYIIALTGIFPSH